MERKSEVYNCMYLQQKKDVFLRNVLKEHPEAWKTSRQNVFHISFILTVQ